jgi:Protein of unknown function (DUF2840)
VRPLKNPEDIGYPRVRHHCVAHDIVRAVAEGERYSTVPFVRAGGEILLRLSGRPRVQKALQAIDIVETLGIDPPEAAPEHWQHVHNRLFVNENPHPPTRLFGTELGSADESSPMIRTPLGLW